MVAVCWGLFDLPYIAVTAMPWYLCLLGAAIASLFGAYTELITRDGNDTLTVPVVNSIVLLLFHFAAIG